MRILFVSHVPPDASGSGIYVARVAEQLLALGDEVSLLTPSGSTPPVLDPRIERAEVGSPGLPGSWNLPFAFPTFSGHRDSALLYDDLMPEQLETYLRVWRKALDDVLRAWRPNVVHVNHAFLLAGLLAHQDRVPYVVVSHGSEVVRPLGKRYRVLQLHGVRKAAAVVSVSEESRSALEARLGVPAVSVEVVPPGFDPLVFYPGPRRLEVLHDLGVDGDRPCVAYAGRLVGYKRVGDLLEAVALLPHPNRPAVLILGSGGEHGRLVADAARLGVEATFHNHISEPAAVADVFRSVDLIVVPSEDDPYPMASLEALACGTPLLVSDRCGTAHLVQKSEAGAVFPTGNVSRLADLLRSRLAEGTAQESRDRGVAAVSGHAWSGLALRLRSVYERALEGGATSDATLDGATLDIALGGPDDVDEVLQLWRDCGHRPSDTDSAAVLLELLKRSECSLLIVRSAGVLVASALVSFDGWRGHVYRFLVCHGAPARVEQVLLHAAQVTLASWGCRRAAIYGDRSLETRQMFCRLQVPRDVETQRFVIPLPDAWS